MDLRQLTYLVAVVDAGGFRAAAERLQVAQPTLSKALRMLEGELDLALLVRSTRGVEPTAAGAELVEHARELIAGFSTARDAMRQIATGDSGVLRVGMVSGILCAGELVAPILTAFRERFPGLRLELDEIAFADPVTSLLRGVVDVVILRGPLTARPLACAELGIVAIAAEPRVLLVAATHELAHEVSVKAEDILAFPTLPLASTESWSAFWQLNSLRGGSLADARVAPAGTASEVQAAVAMHDVVVSIPRSAARLQPNPLVTAIPLDDVPFSVIGIAARRSDRRPHVRAFVETAQRAAGEHLHLMPGAVPPAQAA